MEGDPEKVQRVSAMVIIVLILTGGGAVVPPLTVLPATLTSPFHLSVRSLQTQISQHIFCGLFTFYYFCKVTRTCVSQEFCS